jgi:hypothetical protein
VNENIEPLLIEQPLLNTNSTEDACICTNNTVVNIDLNESTDIVENVYNESVSENESTCSESIDTNNLNVLCLNCCGLKKKTRWALKLHVFTSFMSFFSLSLIHVILSFSKTDFVLSTVEIFC